MPAHRVRDASIVIVREESPARGFDEFPFHAVGTESVRTIPRMELQIMLPGKIPPDILKSLVFTHLGKKDPDLLLGPRVGEDASLIRVGKDIIVVATDPITGSIEDVGRLAVHINANDIATFGVQPRWFLASIMLPQGCTQSDLKHIIQQIDTAAKSLEIAVAGGHTEITSGLDRPIIAGFMIGVADDGKYVTSSGARPGDHFIMTKSIALEGTSILATEGSEYLLDSLDSKLLKEARTLGSMISVVKEGLAAFKTGYLTAMHDPTEGGIAGGIHEICDASEVGCSIRKSQIPIHSITELICEILDINPMHLISSGSMLMTCSSDFSTDVIKAINSVGVSAAVIGEVVKDSSRRYIIVDGEPIPLSRPESDALWAALDRVTQK
ncbi:MAG: AIR synthase family protein [Promethearchaeota archaeon]